MEPMPSVENSHREPGSAPAKGDRWKALRVRNLKYYVVGQAVSMVGSFVQMFAQTILILRLSPNAQVFTTTIIFQFLPLLVLGPWGGLVADRFDNRTILILTSTLSLTTAAALAWLVHSGGASVTHVQALAFVFGIVSAFERPAAQAILSELAGPDDIANAVALNAMIPPIARLLGPVVAGILVETVELAWCFAVNALSYVAVIVAVVLLRPTEFYPRRKADRAKGQLRNGFSYAWQTPPVRTPLLAMVIVGTLAFNFSTVMPLMNRFTFGNHPRWLTAALSASAIGSLIGGAVLAGKRESSQRTLALAAVAFALTLVALALAPAVWVWVLAGVPVGITATWFTTAVTTLLQRNSSPAMLGRVMALFSIAFLGTTPIGAAMVGLLTQHVNARAPFVLASIGTLTCGLALLRSNPRELALESAPSPTAGAIPSRLPGASGSLGATTGAFETQNPRGAKAK
jgi:MFS family permease